MSELDEVRRLFRQAVQRAEDDRVQVMLTGRRVDADTVTLAGAERDKVWVRSTDDSREQTQAWGQSAIANAHVRVRRNAAGELELDGPAYGSGLATGIQASVTLPVLDGRVTKATWYGHNFSPGRVRRSDGGGLTATVEGFVFNGAAVGNTEIVLTATATSGKQALSCVVYNPLTGAFSQVTGSNFDAGTPVADVEAYNSLTLAQGLVPLGGFLLANGATTLEGARWVDARTYLEPRGPLHRYDATSAPGTGDDSADGYSIGSLWHNVTADTMYVCLDATVGAAVWKLATGGGVTVKEVDGTPSVANVTEIRVTNGTLTDVGSGVVEIATGGGGGGGSSIERVAGTIVYDSGVLTSAASFDTGTISLTGYDYCEVLLMNARSSRAAVNDSVFVAFNADATNGNYEGAGPSGINGAGFQRSATVVSGTTATANWNGNAAWRIFDPAGDKFKTMISYNQADFNNASSAFVRQGVVMWKNTAAITRIQMTTDGGTTFQAGTRFVVVGFKKETYGGSFQEATGTTTNATATTLASISVSAGEAVSVKAHIIGKKDDETAGAARELLIAARRASGGNVTQIGTAHGTLIEDSAGTPAIDADVDTATQTVRLRVTGIASETWRWTARYDVARSAV